ncbi:MAG: DUF6675 family protein [Mobilitalea sp.]
MKTSLKFKHFALRYLCTVFIACFIMQPVFAAGVFDQVSETEIKSLDRGEAIIRPLRDVNRMGLSPQVSQEAKELRARVLKLKPNYITEFMQVISVADLGESVAIQDKLVKALADVKGYIKIPYWSERFQTTYDLFDKMIIVDSRKTEDEYTIEVLQHMKPFNDFRAEYRYSYRHGFVRFSSVNLEPIVYTPNNFSSVSPGGMIWELYAFESAGKLNVYGIGAVKAFDFLGIFRDRLEPSFMGRVKAFFEYVSQKMK